MAASCDVVGSPVIGLGRRRPRPRLSRGSARVRQPRDDYLEASSARCSRVAARRRRWRRPERLPDEGPAPRLLSGAAPNFVSAISHLQRPICVDGSQRSEPIDRSIPRPTICWVPPVIDRRIGPEPTQRRDCRPHSARARRASPLMAAPPKVMRPSEGDRCPEVGGWPADFCFRSDSWSPAVKTNGRCQLISSVSVPHRRRLGRKRGRQPVASGRRRGLFIQKRPTRTGAGPQ